MISLNPSLIQDYSFEKSRLLPREVHVAKYPEIEGKQLRYIGASHTHTTMNDRGLVTHYDENPTLALFDQQVIDYKPDFILIEAPDFFGVKEKFSDSRECADGTAFHHMNEVAHAAYIADKHNIAYQGGEPDDALVFEKMRERGYSYADIMGHYALRNVPYINQNGQGDVSAALIESRITEDFGRHQCYQHIPEEERINYSEFLQWFDQHKPDESMQLSDLVTNDVAPIRGESATYFQRAQADLGDIREENINRVLQNALNKYDRVLVQYGNGHYMKSQPVYEQAFGQPTIELAKPFEKAHSPQDLLKLQLKERALLKQLMREQTPQLKLQWQRQCHENLASLNDYLQNNAWPKAEIYGDAVENACFLMAQHGDGKAATASIIKLQQQVLEKMERDNANTGYIGFVTDRICYNRKQPQIYGTVTNPDYPVQSAHQLEARRAMMGLGESHQAYINRVQSGDAMAFRKIIEHNRALVAQFDLEPSKPFTDRQTFAEIYSGVMKQPLPEQDLSYLERYQLEKQRTALSQATSPAI